MSGSLRLQSESDNPRIELPVFVTPTELVFALNKRRLLLTVFNPYHNEAQFKIMTTSPERFDVSITKGMIKPNRRIDITIRLPSSVVDELPEPTDALQAIDYFRITLQVGQLKGNKQIKVHWCLSAELIEDIDTSGLLEERHSTPKYKSTLRQSKPTASSPTTSQSTLSSSSQKSTLQISRSSTSSNQLRPIRQANLHHQSSGSNVNLVCTICAIVCVLTLFLPLSIDFELCKKASSFQNQETNSAQQQNSFISQLSSIFSVSYEMKLGCSFALGLFTYRLISTLPD